MPVTLRIEETDELRMYVREFIEGQVRGMIREDILGIVHGEIAKHRMLDPSSPTLSELIGDEVARQLHGYLQRMGAQITRGIQDKVATEIATHKQLIEAAVSTEFQKQMRARYA